MKSRHEAPRRHLQRPPLRGIDGRLRPDRIVDVLREVGADVVALQEVVSGDGDGDDNQARYIGETLGLHWALGENRKLEGLAPTATWCSAGSRCGW